MNFKFLLSTCFVCSLFTGFAHAEVDELKQLIDLDIEELSTVSIASKRMETVYDAPAIVRVITTDDIAKYGAHDLGDILRRLPNVYEASGSGAIETNFAVRGQSSSNLNKHLLILLNGVSFQDPGAAGYNKAIYNSLPLSMIDRIEFIHGPGSVLYGSGAFAAVMNIVTKNPDYEFGGDLSLVGGSNNTKYAEMTMGGHFHDVELFMAGRKGHTDGVSGVSDINGTRSDELLKNSAETLFLQTKYHDLSFNGYYTIDQGLEPPFPFVTPLNKRTQIRALANIGYEYHFNQDWSASANIAYTKSAITNLHSHSKSLEANVKGRLLDDKLNILLGITTDKKHHKAYLVPASTEVNEGLYYQIDYKPWNWLKLVSGLQINNPGTDKHHPSHRIGSIINFNNHWGMKALYSEAFRSPSLVEKSIFLPPLINRTTVLGPEEIATYDLQVFYHSRKLEASATVYQSKQKNSIRFLPDPDDPGSFRYQNFGKTNYVGFEIDGSYRYSDHWDFEGSVSLQKNRQNGTDDTQLSPNWQVKAGAVYKSDNGIRLGVFNTYTGSPTDNTEFNGSIPVVNPSAGPRNYLSANIELPLNELFDLPSSTPEMSFSIYGEDLLESSDFYTPDTNSTVNTYPIGAGRSVYGRFVVKF